MLTTAVQHAAIVRFAVVKVFRHSKGIFSGPLGCPRLLQLSKSIWAIGSAWAGRTVSQIIPPHLGCPYPPSLTRPSIVSSYPARSWPKNVGYHVLHVPKSDQEALLELHSQRHLSCQVGPQLVTAPHGRRGPGLEGSASRFLLVPGTWLEL